MCCLLLEFQTQNLFRGLLASARIPLVGPFVAAALRQSITCSPLSVSGTRTTKRLFSSAPVHAQIGSFGEPGKTSASFFVGCASRCDTESCRFRFLAQPKTLCAFIAFHSDQKTADSFRALLWRQLHIVAVVRERQPHRLV
jgi:hypothetical protein